MVKVIEIFINKENPENIKKKIQLKELYKKEKVFFCDGVEDVGSKDVVQFYGEPFGVSIKPGMKININEVECLIKEVYADDNNSQKPDTEIKSEMTNTAIVVEVKDFNWESFDENIKRNKVIALKLG